MMGNRSFMRILPTVILLDLALLSLSLVALCLASTVSPEHIQLRGSGNSMYPTIADGDTVLVEMPTNVSSVKVGDIIVYGSIATLPWNPSPSALWIAHRVTGKYEKEGTLYFTTKGDNNSATDPWQVPEYWVAGKVVSVSHTGNAYQIVPETQSAQSPPDGLAAPEEWLIILGTVSVFAIYMLKAPDNRKRGSSSSQTSLQECRDCRYFEVQYFYRLMEVNGRLGIRKRVDLSKGYCEKRGVTIFEGMPRKKCRKHTWIPDWRTKIGKLRRYRE